jgi:hypothetical protein
MRHTGPDSSSRKLVWGGPTRVALGSRARLDVTGSRTGLLLRSGLYTSPLTTQVMQQAAFVLLR